ncbi:hypothetical protein [Salinicoccus roseus]|uniref:ATP-binding protein n=1 Tax=Salinicoccus roseus TaxID=45670 RepID=UPI001EF4BA95|nr:hypothetical protein [Salinicoccus roseus]MCG7333032.1 hypothetical protein [Salinicoccus roseus]
MRLTNVITSLKSRRRKVKSSNTDSLIKTEALFVEEKKKEKIGVKSSLIEYAALQKGMETKRINSRTILINLNNKRKLSFHNMNGIDSSRVGISLCNNKDEILKLMREFDLPVTKAKKFDINSYDKAIHFVEEIEFPVVVKPVYLSRSRGITTNIQSFDALEKAWNKAIKAYVSKSRTRSILIEKHMDGEDYRFFVVGRKVVSVTHRKRANVVGDGFSNIKELVRKKNIMRSENPYMSKYLISENESDLDGLREKGLDFESIPLNGEEVKLYSSSNPAAGRDSVDVTHSVHPGYKSEAIKALEAVPGMEYAGIDIISKDITSKPTIHNHVIGEIESSPAPLTHFPIEGVRRDMAGAIIEHYLQKYD